MEYDADVIIIGAGHNSLTASLYLLESGLRVILVEQAKECGGAAKTAEILEPGYKHDLFATNIGLFLGSQVYSEFKKEFHNNGFDIVVNPQPFSSVFPDKKCIRVYTDKEKTREEFGRFSKDDPKAWADMVAYFQKVATFLFPLLQAPMPSFKMFRQLWKMYWKLGYEDMLELIRVLILSPRSFLDERFESEEAKALLSPWAFHLGLSPDCAGGATFCFLESVADHLNGMAFSKGGVGNLIHALKKLNEKRGAKIVLGKAVTKLIVNKATARGVKLDDGSTLYAKKAVVACVTPKQFLQIIPQSQLPEDFIIKFKKYRFGPGTLMIHATADQPLKWEASEDLSSSAYVHVGPYMSDIAMTYTQCMEGYLPSDPLLVIAQQTNTDKTRAPQGKHVLWIQVRAFPNQPVGDSLGEIKIGTWDDIKERVADRVIDKISKFAPEIKKIIRKRMVYSPMDLEKADPNIVGGDMVGGCHTLDQNFMFRPIPGWSRYKTPIKHLYLTGHSTWPGGGLNATSGHLSALQVLKDI